MSKAVFTGFSDKPDLGKLKAKNGEYHNLQNIKGRGGRGRKREGVQSFAVLSSSIMGIYDLKYADSPDSLDKFLVLTRDGTFNVYDPSELISVFTYLIDTTSSGALDFQSPDLNWWQFSLSSATDPIYSTSSISAPSSSQSSDLNVGVSDLFGFLDATGVSRVWVEDGFIKTRRYALASGDSVYSTPLAFAAGYGLVFQDIYGTRRRMTIANGGFPSISDPL